MFCLQGGRGVDLDETPFPLSVRAVKLRQRWVTACIEDYLHGIAWITNAA